MRIRVLSDLHLSQGTLDLPPADADVVVLAGDVARPPEAIAWARALRTPVVYVPGNHEFYGSTFGATVRALRDLAAGSDVHVLDDDAIVLDGARFLGTTLWTDFALYGRGDLRAAAYAEATRLLRDFARIRHDDGSPFTPDACAARFAAHARWLDARLDEPHDGPTVVVTHHAPSRRSLHPRFVGSLLNPCFLSDAEHLAGRAALWIHGHTHDGFDYDLRGTRVVCNPRGYARHGVPENPAFDPALCIEVGAP
jgi:predicted phosphodiesterase